MRSLLIAKPDATLLHRRSPPHPTEYSCITPCRGFTMETTTALVTAFGSYLGIPLSTTQTHVGSTTGVGLAEGRKGAVKWTLLAKMFAGAGGALLRALVHVRAPAQLRMHPPGTQPWCVG